MIIIYVQRKLMTHSNLCIHKKNHNSQGHRRHEILHYKEILKNPIHSRKKQVNLSFYPLDFHDIVTEEDILFPLPLI